MTSADWAGTLKEMQDTVPPHRTSLTPHQTAQLTRLTKELIHNKPDVTVEYQRFLNIQQRSLPHPNLTLTGKTVLVTGGTGCIGSTLIEQIMRYNPARVVSLSRGVTTPWVSAPHVEYILGDVRDRHRVNTIINWVQPDIIFHVSAQRSPGLAEVEVHRTVTTNIFGTRNILQAALQAGVPQVVCASTGKALRPYSPEIYTASKRAAEWVASQAANDMLVSAARFTHVIDNSIFHDKLRNPTDIIRLHNPHTVFYVQSALESAQLLLHAAVGVKLGEFRVHAITDLGWPVSLLDVTLGALGATQKGTPVYLSGYDPGYEEVSFPGLYDPLTAGDVSPLMNSFETAAMVNPPCPMIDTFTLNMTADTISVRLLQELEEDCGQGEQVRDSLDRLSWALLDATLTRVPVDQLCRCVRLIGKHEMTPAHRRITDAVRTHAGLC